VCVKVMYVASMHAIIVPGECAKNLTVVLELGSDLSVVRSEKREIAQAAEVWVWDRGLPCVDRGAAAGLQCEKESCSLT